MRDALAKSDFNSVYANVKFADNGQINLPQIVVQIQNGNLVPIYTTKDPEQADLPDPGLGQALIQGGGAETVAPPHSRRHYGKSSCSFFKFCSTASCWAASTG